MKTATSAILHFTLEDDGIVRAVSRPGIQPTGTLIREAEAACREVRGDRRRPALWDIRDLSAPRPDSWSEFIQGLSGNLVAIAVLGDRDQVEVLGAFPDLIHRMIVPMRLFMDEAEALRWLAGYV